jgi:hypothetical protein
MFIIDSSYTVDTMTLRYRALDKLIVGQLVKTFTAFYEIQMFINLSQ